MAPEAPCACVFARRPVVFGFAAQVLLALYWTGYVVRIKPDRVVVFSVDERKLGRSLVDPVMSLPARLDVVGVGVSDALRRYSDGAKVEDIAKYPGHTGFSCPGVFEANVPGIALSEFKGVARLLWVVMNWGKKSAAKAVPTTVKQAMSYLLTRQSDFKVTAWRIWNCARCPCATLAVRRRLLEICDPRARSSRRAKPRPSSLLLSRPLSAIAPRSNPIPMQSRLEPRRFGPASSQGVVRLSAACFRGSWCHVGGDAGFESRSHRGFGRSRIWVRWSGFRGFRTHVCRPANALGRSGRYPATATFAWATP